MTPSLYAPGSRRRYMAHPRGDEMRYARQAGEYGWSLAVRATVAGVALATLFLGLPLVGWAICLALGLDPMAGAR